MSTSSTAPSAKPFLVSRPSRLLAVMSLAILAVAALGPPVQAAGPKPKPSDPLDFGPNVLIFDPSMPQSQIQAMLDAIATQQVDNEFGAARYALLFKPGTYGSAANPLTFQVGYYTAVAGLGRSPSDVTI